ncbi:MAG: hypothetical protein R3F24_06000 [Gammaproteobacteria bacterium]
MRSHFLAELVLLCGVLGIAADSVATTINFDALTPGLVASDILADRGVKFWSAAANPDDVAIGDTITLTFITPFISILSPDAPGAVSPANYALGATVARSDVLFEFATPVTSVSLATDINLNDTRQLVRLLALAPTANPAQFRILALDEGYSDAVTAPDNLLAVSLGGTTFGHALFQITGGGAEGFDNLNFTPVPLSGSLAFLGMALAGLAGLRARTCGSGAPMARGLRSALS